MACYSKLSPNTAKYWLNLGSQESAIVIGPVSPFVSVKCGANDGGLYRLFKFTDLQPKLGPVFALYQVDCNFYYGIQFRKYLLTGQSSAYRINHSSNGTILATVLPMLGQCWTISNFALGTRFL